MRELLEGSQAVARTVARCRPAVVCAYPISPQTHIVEALSVLVRTGKLKNCQFLNVESEFAAMSVAIGASAAGGRAYTATASQGLLYMTEALFNASGLKLPIVMTVANRAIGGPINIWNDQSDALTLRDSGWLQLYAADNQEAADLHVIAYRVAEELSIPVMVCMDGFVLTHASDVLELPGQEQVDDYLPAPPPGPLDVDHPSTLGMMAGPETFTEVKYLQHEGLLDALTAIERAAADFERAFGRPSGTPVREIVGASSSEAPAAPDAAAAAPDADAAGDELVVLAMGSVLGTASQVVRRLRAAGRGVRLVAISTYRPFPTAAVNAAIGGADRVVVLDRAVELGAEGILTGEIRRALAATRAVGDVPPVHSVVAGLGGRPITEASLADVLDRALAGALERLTFLDLDDAVVAAGAASAALPGAARDRGPAGAHEERV